MAVDIVENSVNWPFSLNLIYSTTNAFLFIFLFLINHITLLYVFGVRQPPLLMSDQFSTLYPPLIYQT